MSDKAEKLQEAIGLIKDEYVEEAHAGEAVGEASGTVAEPIGVAAAASEAKPEAAPEAVPGAKPEAKPEAAPAKVVKMPAQRKRRAGVPLAIAACLVIVLGAGALAFTNMSKPTADEAARSDDSAKTESAYLMAESATEAAGEGATTCDEPAPGNLVPGTVRPGQREGEAFVLTAGVWNDNDNWAFFTNLVNSGTIGFPVYGLDPTNRVKVSVVDEAGAAVRNQDVTLLDAAGNELWRSTTDKDGAAYLFYRGGDMPASVSAAGVTQDLAVFTPTDARGQQDDDVVIDDPVGRIEDVTLTVGAGHAPAKTGGLQVMFIVDTTGSMSDEIAYLQKDFASIAADAGNDGIEYSVNFYRDEGDEYVTKCNGFTSDVAAVQAALNKEYADGGGDTPEAVAQILTETITNNGAWRDDCNKLAFLIFDAPPHDGTDAAIDAAVRSAAERGIRLVPVVASNADRGTELFGRALAIMTDATYVFLTDDSGVGESHLEPIIGDYTVELLHDVIVGIINDNR